MTPAAALTLTRGPLSPERLDEIGGTYGKVDRRYGSRDFCDGIFNRNPFGYSWHAFVTAAQRTVGHYAVIPMRSVARGTPVQSGKGEALYLDEAFRSTPIEYEGETFPAGIALMNHLHRRVLADGAAVIHNITSAEIGMIQRMDGFRALTEPREQSHFLISAGELRQLQRTRATRLASRALMAAQRAQLALARAALSVSGAPAVERDAAGDERHLSAMTTADPAGGGRWTIARDLDTLRWFRRLDRLEIVSVAGRPEHFAAMTKGNARELLHWAVPPDAGRTALALLAALLEGSIRDHAWIVSVSRGMVDEHGRALQSALRMLGFMERRIDQPMFVKSADPYYLDPRHLVMNRMFNL